MSCLFHFSDDPAIVRFLPRPVRIASDRPPGMEWLNGPLVWAVDDRHQPMYLFPRELPRILVWPKTTTTEADRYAYFGDSNARMPAYIEPPWQTTLEQGRVLRYELPAGSFTSLDDAGMWVSRDTVGPIDCQELRDLPAVLSQHAVELRIVPALASSLPVWNTTLHASGIRLRNAVNGML